MIVGVPCEIKSDEYRISLLPVGAQLLKEDGHTVLIEKDAGLGSGFDNEAYTAVGAELIDTPEEIFERADMIVGVKEPQPVEIEMSRPGQIMFTYFHFAASRELTEGFLNSGATAVAYETLEDADGRLPLLTPMSEVAGKMSIQEGAKYLERPMMGRGVLLGGVVGVAPAQVLILGGGIVGTAAARVAAGMGANVTIMDINLDRLRYLDDVMPANITTVYCDPHVVQRYLEYADLVIGAVLIPGGRAPKLVRREHLPTMKAGSVVVDVAVDQGGCTEMTRPTTHGEPTFIVDDVVFYCVANMPGAVGRTSSQALCNATLPYARQLAKLGVEGFAKISAGHAAAINTKDGKITNTPVAEAFEDLPSAC
jgi:alanine dehydrogenase